MQRVGHCPRGFTYRLTSESFNNSMKKVQLLTLSCRWRNWSTEKVSNFSRVTQLSGGAAIQTLVLTHCATLICPFFVTFSELSFKNPLWYDEIMGDDFQFSVKFFFIWWIVYKACLGDSSHWTAPPLWKPGPSGSSSAFCLIPHQPFQKPQPQTKMVAGTEISSLAASATSKDLMLWVELCPSKILMLKS